MADHYFSKKPACADKSILIEDCLRGIRLLLRSSSGVFSAKKVDEGTRLLAEAMIIPKKGDVLDMGCGIGAIGIVAAHLTTGKVVMSDINERACALAKKNSSGLKNAEVRCGDAYGPVFGMKFDAILLNPPQTAGKQLCFSLIENAKRHLNKGGTLQVVARHNKGGETLSKKMMEAFGNAQSLAKKGAYRVYISKKTE